MRTGVAAPEEMVDVRGALDAMRLVKDGHELALMRRAAAISAAAHRRAMERTRGRAGTSTRSRPSSLHEFLRNGAQAVAYPSIVGSGPNACVLHYRDNNRQMQDGELLLIDAGCEYQGYASDITRTFPVNGRFSGPQKAVYELVLAAQLACLDAVRPASSSTTITRPPSACSRRATSTSDCAGARSTKCWRPARTSSSTCTAPATGSAWTCTTPASIRSKGASQKLAPGMVLTVEPGTYIRPADNVPEAFWDIGIRIEDDVLVTATGTENLTCAAPKTVADVEAACKR